jgi:hypothetical protein
MQPSGRSNQRSASKPGETPTPPPSDQFRSVSFAASRRASAR